MSWMAWTWPTAMFFIAIALALVVLTLSELVWPTRLRRGRLLPMATTRGDRFFIALLASAFVHIGWLALADTAPYPASIACICAAGILLRWG